MENPKTPQADSALPIKRNPIEVEYTRLLSKYRNMEELIYKAERDRSWSVSYTHLTLPTKA